MRAARPLAFMYSRIGGQTNGRVHMARIISWAFARPGSDRFAITFAYPRASTDPGNSAEALCCRRCRGNWFAVLLFTCQHCPQCACRFVGDGDSGDVGRSACRQCMQPRTRRHVFAAQRSDIALAPWIRSARRYRSPPLRIRPICSFFPLACILGVNPSQAPKCRADWN